MSGEGGSAEGRAAVEAFLAALPDVSRETVSRLDAYADLLTTWQARINLVARSTVPHLWTRHFLDSAQLWPLIGDRTGTLVDLGSGAGFPGLVLAAMGHPAVTLIESDARKCAFLRQVAADLSLPVTILTQRIEAVAAGSAATVTARALAPLPRLLPLAARLAGSDTLCLFLKGRQASEEIAAVEGEWHADISVIPSMTDDEGAIVRLAGLTRRSDRPG